MGDPDQTVGKDDPMNLAITARLDALEQLGRIGSVKSKAASFAPLLPTKSRWVAAS